MKHFNNTLTRRLVSLFLVLALALCACSALAEDAALRIGVMSGPTGMGMAQLMSQENAAYAYEIYAAPTDAVADLAAGTLDLLCLPTNTAASLSNAKEDYISVLAVNCLGSLYLLTDADTVVNDIHDLDGQTVYASVKTSTTGPILDFLFAQNGIQVNVEWEADHDALAARLPQGEVHIAVLPEPKATVAMTKAEGWHVALNLSKEWEAVCETGLTMGCIVARNDSLAAKADLIAPFLADYSASVSFISDAANRDESAELIAAAGILPAAGVAKKALINLDGSIVYLDGAAMKTALQAFYDVIGLDQPADSFYYAAD